MQIMNMTDYDLIWYLSKVALGHAHKTGVSFKKFQDPAVYQIMF